KPLIAHTVESAKKSGSFDRLILSTDDESIISIVKEYEIEIPFVRPKELAQDDTSHLAVIQHAVSWLKDNDNYRSDYVMILQPTSPFRQPFHIKEAVDLILKTGADSVLAVCELSDNFSPERNLFIEKDGFLFLANGDPIYKRVVQRQKASKIYSNSTMIYLFKTDLLFGDNPNFFGEKVAPYIVDKKYTVDINEPGDWGEAERAIC
ncbi:acylneuraminate cytidylyltransferase family protein, partial [Patescibacteria group bacterium]|nr:acylneuraminate cytidylyltransferase family protein [Patescibacteria group bacterium]